MAPGNDRKEAPAWPPCTNRIPGAASSSARTPRLVDALAAQPAFLIWTVSGWTAVLWTAMGVLGLLSMARLDTARSYSLPAGVVFAALAVWGFIDGNDVAEILVAGTTTNVMHAILAGLGLVAGLLPPDDYGRSAGVVGSFASSSPPQAAMPRARTTRNRGVSARDIGPPLVRDAWSAAPTRTPCRSPVGRLTGQRTRRRGESPASAPTTTATITTVCAIPAGRPSGAGGAGSGDAGGAGLR
jgi:hypothetical protein